MSEGFLLHPQLAAETHPVGDLPLCRVLLMDDAGYPWTILVPRRAGVREICELADADQQTLIRESSELARALLRVYAPDKLNVAALGNVVPQLHVHHIARYATDAAWPHPVWGRVPRRPYPPDAAQAAVEALRAALAPGLVPRFRGAT
jgi:diadenosine tetraphosphate (Ap4A) HIT family hydrolase